MFIIQTEGNMMLRSSSTPILGSLLSSHPESPNSHHHSEINLAKQRFSSITFNHHHNHNRKYGSVHLINSCQSPISPPVADLPGHEFGSNGFRKAQSEGNLEGLLASSAANDGFDEFDNLHKRFSQKHNCTMLYVSEGEEVSSDDEEEDVEEQDGVKAGAMLNSGYIGMEKSYAYADRVADSASQGESQRVLSRTHMVVGLGLDDFTSYVGGGSYGGGGSNGGGNEGKWRGSDGDDGGGSNKVEEYYKRMLKENPRDPLFMRNYAEFLCQTKNDLTGAEEYYSRAILADPGDGEVLSQYGKVIWALHGDQDRAAGYFDRAVQAAPEDSVVLAAQASFLWETEEDEEDLDKAALLPRENAMAAANA